MPFPHLSGVITLSSSLEQALHHSRASALGVSLADSGCDRGGGKVHFDGQSDAILAFFLYVEANLYFWVPSLEGGLGSLRAP